MVTAWVGDVGKWWWTAVVVIFLGIWALVHFVTEFRKHLGWVVCAFLIVLLGASIAAYAKERRRRLTGSAQVHQPPGGGLPHLAPVEYQVTALRQLIAELSETLDEFGFMNLNAAFKNVPRTGTKGLYEPMSIGTCDAGLKRLVELGELVPVGQKKWRIVKAQ